jgi:hypothetical protein
MSNVTVNPPNTTCMSGCQYAYAAPTIVTLTAAALIHDDRSPPTPSANVVFASWNGCDSTSGPTCTVNVNAARSVTATFTVEPGP